MGIGAALLMPGTLSTITSVFPPEERAKAVGIWAGFAGAGGTLGILVSGALLEEFYWGSIFVMTAVLAASRSSRSSRWCRRPVLDRTGPNLDPLGAIVSAIGIGLLVFGIIEGPDRGWTDPITLAGIARRGGVPRGVPRRRAAHRRTAARSAACSSTTASRPGRRRCSCSSSPCSASSSCRCSSCRLVLGYSTLHRRARPDADDGDHAAAVASCRARCRSATGTSSSAVLGLFVSAIGFGAVRDRSASTVTSCTSSLTTLVIGAGRGPGDDAGDQRHRVVAAARPSRVWPPPSTTPHASSAPLSASRFWAVCSTSGTATRSTPTSVDCPRHRRPGPRGARDRCSGRARSAKGSAALADASREAFVVGMRYALFVVSPCCCSAPRSCGSAARHARRRSSRTSSTSPSASTRRTQPRRTRCCRPDRLRLERWGGPCRVRTRCEPG